MEFRELMPHQEEGKVFARSRDHFGLFMEMRLGKTLTTIRWAQETPDVRNIIVFAPNTVFDTWERELTKEGEYFVSAYLGKSSKIKMATLEDAFSPLVLQPARRVWVLLNYEFVRMQPDVVNLETIDTVILDESTVIKSPTTRTSVLFQYGFRHVRHRICLSGFPAPEGPSDFFPQFKFLHGKFMGTDNFYHWRSKYMEQNDMGKWVPKIGNRDLIHRIVHEKAFFKRRADVKIGSKKIYETRRVILPKHAREEYNKIELDFATSSGDETEWSIVVDIWLAKLCGGFHPKTNEPFHDAKFDELMNLLENELAAEQVVVWFRFNHELQSVYEACRHRGIPAARLLGETPVAERSNVLGLVRTGKVRAVLAQIKLARFGIDLSPCDTAIYYSNSYSAQDRSQSEDRIISPVKDTPQLIIDLVAKDTVDEDVVEALVSKSADAISLMMKVKKRMLYRTNTKA